MKHLLVLLLFCAGHFSFAQYEGKVSSGIVEYTNEDYNKAIEYLTEALNHQDQLKEKTIPKAYYYLGSAYLKKSQNAASKEDFSNATYALEASKAFQKASNDSKYEKKVKEDYTLLDQVLLLYGYKNIEEKKFEEAKSIFEVSVSINEQLEDPNWIAYDFSGQAHLQLQDSSTAQTNFEKAIKTFQANLPEKPDATIAYTYLRLAMMIDDMEKSLQLIKEGLSTLENEKNRLGAVKGLESQYKSTFLNEWYPAAKADLEKTQLNILLKNPGKLDQALNEFKAATEKDPKNYQLWMAYAQLMENKSVDKAAEIYLDAIKINPSEFMGHYNLAALYINEGNRMYNMASATHDKNTASQLKQRANIYYTEGYKQLNSCHTIESENKSVLEYLILISKRLDKSDDYKKYTEKLNKL